MLRISSWILAFAAFAPAAEPAKPDAKLAARVAELVRTLADEDFDRRQTAQDELVKLGKAILPLLDQLEPFAEPEVAFRVVKVRRAVGGIAEELREILAKDAPSLLDQETKWGLSDRAQKLIADNRVVAGDFLLSLIANPKHELHRSAVNAFVQSWPLMSGDQIRTYLEQSLLFNVTQRPAYPRGVDAMIGIGYQFRHGWGSRPQDEKFKIVTITHHELDGEPYGKPYRYPYASSGCTTGWVRTKDLAVGKHSFSAELKFEAEHLGKTVKGSVRSDKFTFEILPAETPDDLIAPKDAAVEKQVRAALRITETEEPNPDVAIAQAFNRQQGFGGTSAIDWWRPQITWTGQDGKPNGLHVPIWRLNNPLPVDLVFDTTIRIEATKEEFAADTLIALKGTTRNLGYVSPRDTQALAKGRSGFVKVRVILKPSRGVALTSPQVTKYFPSEIVSDILRIKVGPAEEATTPQK